jgi:hypothetical protein
MPLVSLKQTLKMDHPPLAISKKNFLEYHLSGGIWGRLEVGNIWGSCLCRRAIVPDQHLRGWEDLLNGEAHEGEKKKESKTIFSDDTLKYYLAGKIQRRKTGFVLCSRERNLTEMCIIGESFTTGERQIKWIVLATIEWCVQLVR